MDLEFLRLQYDQLRRQVDENISQRRRMQEYVLAFVAATYVWTITNNATLQSLPPSALIWMRWLPTLVVLGASGRWLGHQLVIKTVAPHMRSIEVYFREIATNSPYILPDSTNPLSANQVRIAELGYESAIHEVYNVDWKKNFAVRYAASVSEFGIGILTLILTILVSYSLFNISTEIKTISILDGEIAGLKVHFELK